MEDEPEPATARDYFSIKNPKTERHKWLVGFYTYLISPDAGIIKGQNRINHASQVRRLLEALKPNGHTIECLIEDDCDAIWKVWAYPRLEKKTMAAGMIASYLGSLEKFLDFVCSDRIASKNMPVHKKETLDRLKFLKSRLSGWRTSVHKETQAAKWAKYVEECDSAVVPENVKNILSSKPAIQGMKALTAARAGKDLTPYEFTAAKDLILAAFSIQNGSRPGTVNNATLQNYESARRERQSGKMVILITRHKTAQHGPAMLCMDTQLCEWMSTYVLKIRPQFAIPEDTCQSRWKGLSRRNNWQKNYGLLSKSRNKARYSNQLYKN